jgi:hypothetical protein
MYHAYKQSVSDNEATQTKNTAVAAPSVDAIRSAIDTGKFPDVNESKEVLGTDALRAAADFHKQHPDMEVVGFPTGQNSDGKSIFSLFYGKNLHDVTLAANGPMAKQLGVAEGADVALVSAANHVVNRIAETNIADQADRELEDHPQSEKLKFGKESRDELLPAEGTPERDRIQKSMKAWSVAHPQTYSDPAIDLAALKKTNPQAAADVEKYVYGAGNITKIHDNMVEAAIRVKSEAQKDLESGPVTKANANAIIAKGAVDPTWFPEQVKTAKAFVQMETGDAVVKQVQEMEGEPSKLAGENSLAAGAQLQGLLQSDQVKNDPALAVRVNRLVSVANTAHAAWTRDKISTNAAMVSAQEYAKNGDPARAGAMLLDHSITLQDMKNRNLDTKLIEDAVAWAKAHSPDPTHPYSAAAANSWENDSKNARFVDFFGNSDSLIRQGGTLDQLTVAGGKISKDDFQALNKAKNWASFQAGHPGLAGYQATALGVADDYAKVLGGSIGSDTARTQVLNIINPANSPAQREAAIQAMRAAIASQRSSKIGNNPFLQQMYGETSNEPAAAHNAATPPVAGKLAPVPNGMVRMVGPKGNTKLVPQNRANDFLGDPAYAGYKPWRQ